MNKLMLMVVALSACLSGEAVEAGSLFDDFVNPPVESRPWTYWFLLNSLTDRETIDADMDDIARLGFGGVLTSDSRAYHIDDDHLQCPPAPIRWGGPEWQEMMAYAIRAAARNGIAFSLNIAASGGHLRGEVDAKGDNPKQLVFRRYRPGERFETPDSPYYRDVAVFAVRTARPLEPTDWLSAGDGVMSVASSKRTRLDAGRYEEAEALEVRELASTDAGVGLDASWTVVRFGSDIIPNAPEDIDVLDSEAVKRHLSRTLDGLLEKVADVTGPEKTFCALYNVSWEGLMPTWSPTFEADYERFEGRSLRPDLPLLAGFTVSGRDADAFRRSYRHARGKMMVRHFYATVREWANARGLKAYSESGGPWRREPELFGECDQLEFLLANDIPQGEFWMSYGAFTSDGGRHANKNGRFLSRGIASAAHLAGQRYASVEAFTHMYLHWSVDPCFIKPVGDQAFADGLNRMVFHTYTSSPKRFGVPGLEYFAGTHINRNVTWHDEFAPFVKYLGRCQSVLQAGENVADVLVVGDDRPYCGWSCSTDVRGQSNGRHREIVSDEPKLAVRIPRGHGYDFTSSTVFDTRKNALEGHYPVVVAAADALSDPELIGRRLKEKGLLPDVLSDAEAASWTWSHRRTDEGDFYFLAGEGKGNVTFRASAPAIEVWDPVTGTKYAVPCERCADGRTCLKMELPQGGSAIVAFLKNPPVQRAKGRPDLKKAVCVRGPWTVSFAYPKGIAARPPDSVRLSDLVDFRSREDLRHFAGAATYRCSFSFDDDSSGASVSLGDVPSGLAHVWVNDIDCGTVWCAPWRADISHAVRRGTNALTVRYVNNWHNRMVGDCQVPDDECVTKTVVRHWKQPRTFPPGKTWPPKPKMPSGYCPNDPLQPAGLLGPIEVLSRGETSAPVIRDIPYDASLGRWGAGDLYLPEHVDDSTPVALLIHGGGWSTGHRSGMGGVIDYFRRDLGFAVYTIDYRLGSAQSRWPACGDDCVKAANYLLSEGFRAQYGLSARKIWIVGASAGGHLSLWTLTHLPKESVEGVVSISSIGDPVPDFKAHRARYTHLFGKDVTASDVAAVDPRPSIRPGMAPVLCTHAEGDRVVPIASHRAFAEAYEAAGNEVEFFAYPCDCVPGLTGHCIWRPLFRSKKLIPHLETRIADFVRRVRGRVPVK